MRNNLRTIRWFPARNKIIENTLSILKAADVSVELVHGGSVPIYIRKRDDFVFTAMPPFGAATWGLRKPGLYTSLVCIYSYIWTLHSVS